MTAVRGGASVGAMDGRMPEDGIADDGIADDRTAKDLIAKDGIAKDGGLTLIELIVVVTMLSILATMAIPVAKFQVKRQKERELRADLWMMRDAIDHYKDTADKGGIQVKTDSFGYPPDLQTLVDGVDVGTNKVKFLRSIPRDPMTGETEWSLRAMQDDPDSDSWGGQNVFDVHTKSTGTGLDGTKYNTW